MTVEELQKELKKFKPNSKVFVGYCNSCEIVVEVRGEGVGTNKEFVVLKHSEEW